MSGGHEIQGSQKEEENYEACNLTIGFVGRPQIYIEEPRKLPVPIVVKPVKRIPTTVHLLHKQIPWYSLKKKYKEETPVKRRWNFSQWCKRRKNKTIKINESIPKFWRSRSEKSLRTEIKPRSESLPPLTVTKPKTRVKKRSASVKPMTATRYVCVQKYNHRLTMSDRFVNCMYRVCCQFYCYLTCIIVVFCVVVFVL